MSKDQLYTPFIPLLGIAFPFLAGLPLIENKFLSVFLTLLLFAVAAVAGVLGVKKLGHFLRQQMPAQQPLATKIAALSLAGATYGALVFLLAGIAWQLTAMTQWRQSFLLWIAVAGGMGGLVVTLLHEVVIISREKDKALAMTRQAEIDMQQAGTSMAKNDLDPHFFFNCMNTLSHLVRHDAENAYQFVHKLSNVYKYFLRNREKTFVSVEEELDFLDNYFFLLRIRYDDNIRIQKNVEQLNGPGFILPCTLQLLVENAVKHNFFSEKEPLQISITAQDGFIVVSNPVRPKLHTADATDAALHRLKSRYRLLAGQQVIMQTTNNNFFVKLPIVKTDQHDKSSNN